MKSSVDVHNFLQEKNIKHEIFLLPVSVKTAKRAAALAGLDIKEIAKVTLFFADNKPFCAVTPGHCHLSYQKIKKELGAREIKLSNADSLVQLTDYIVGATPPFAFKQKIETLVDKRLIIQEVVYTGSGELNSMLKIRSKDLIKAAEARIVDIVREKES